MHKYIFSHLPPTKGLMSSLSNFSYPPAHSPSPGAWPQCGRMGPRGAGTGTGRGVVSDRNLRGWPGRGLGPSFLKGGWARAGTVPEKMPSWALFVVPSCLLLAPQNLAQVTSQGEVYRGWRSPMPRKRELLEGMQVPGRGCRVADFHAPLHLPINIPGRTQNPTHQLFLRCFLADLGFKAPELFLPNI